MAFGKFAKDVLMNEMESRIAYVGTGHDDGSVFTETAGAPYTRQPVSFGSSFEGSIAQVANATIPIPAGETISWVVFYDAQTLGNVIAFEAITPQLFSNDGTVTVDSSTTLDLNGLEEYNSIPTGL